MQTALECLFGICALGEGMCEPIHEELTLRGKGDQPERLGRAEIPLEGLGMKHTPQWASEENFYHTALCKFMCLSNFMPSQERKTYYFVSNLSHGRLCTSANFYVPVWGH